MIWATTGHRPKYLLGSFTQPRGGESGDGLHDELTEFAMEVIRPRPVAAMIVGMAEGWDMAVAEACHQLGIPYLAALPFVGQERLWSGRSQERYRRLCASAHQVEVVSPHSLNIAYQRRDEWMVDKAAYAKGRLLALYSGVPSGTANTVNYAQEWCVPVENVWDDWKSRWTTD